MCTASGYENNFQWFHTSLNISTCFIQVTFSPVIVRTNVRGFYGIVLQKSTQNKLKGCAKIKNRTKIAWTREKKAATSSITKTRRSRHVIIACMWLFMRLVSIFLHSVGLSIFSLNDPLYFNITIYWFSFGCANEWNKNTEKQQTFAGCCWFC